MFLNFLIGFFRMFWSGSFSPQIILDYLKEIVYYVVPMVVLLYTMPLDPTGWILLIAYYIGAIGIIWNYLIAIKNKF